MTYDPTQTQSILTEIAEERARQDARWGVQNHSPRGGRELNERFGRLHYEEQALMWKHANELDDRHGTMGWDGILLEEVFEALAEKDPRKIRLEVVQVAAVAAAFINSLDRNELNPDKMPVKYVQQRLHTWIEQGPDGDTRQHATLELNLATGQYEAIAFIGGQLTRLVGNFNDEILEHGYQSGGIVTSNAYLEGVK